MKTCRHCKKEKPDEAFSVRQSVCRECQNAYHKRRRQEAKAAKTESAERKPAKIDPIIGQVLTSSWMK